MQMDCCHANPSETRSGIIQTISFMLWGVCMADDCLLLIYCLFYVWGSRGLALTRVSVLMLYNQ